MTTRMCGENFAPKRKRLAGAGGASTVWGWRMSNGLPIVGHHYFSDYLPRGHHLQRVDGALERKRRRDMRFQLALAIPLAELRDAFRKPRRLALRELAPEDADDRAALEQRQVERNLRDLTGGKPDHQQ